MVYERLKLSAYPRLNRGPTPPGTLDKNLVYGSRHLKDDLVFPVTHPDPDLERLGHELARELGSLHTSLTLHREHLAKTRIVPDSGSIRDGVEWLMPHLDKFNCVSFDTESCASLNTIVYAIFGSCDGFVLIVDYRKIPSDSFPKDLHPLVHGRLVLGSRIHTDAQLLRNVEYLAGEVQDLSRSIQAHNLYPYKKPVHPGPGKAGTKCGLKYIPEMLYGHHYGPLSSHWEGGDRGHWVLKWYEQPFDWPDWLYPAKFYRFGTVNPTKNK